MPNDLGLNSACVTIAYMRRLAVSAALLLVAIAPARAADDPLARARLLYNQGQFEAAISAAELARQTPARADAADLVAARAYLERFRASDAADDLVNARDRLRRIDPQHFMANERAEYVVGLGEALFFEGAFGAAADVLDPIVRNPDVLAGDARERVLDWWASALDRDAKPRPEIDRQGVYQRIRTRMEDELSTSPVSGTAAYWLAAAARSQGDVQAAWDAALAAWVRAPLTSDRGVMLRADIDRLVLRAIVPDRAKVTAQPPETLRQQWEVFKERWTRE
jgi:tetratricopeptide (TPR) repeat protein